MIKSIIWDWNGTLLDDRRLCVDVINKLLTRRSLPSISEDKYRRIFDFPVQDYYREIGFDFETEDYHLVATEFIQEYEAGQDHCRLHSGAKDMLNYFLDRGIPQYVLSASQKDKLRHQLHHAGISNYFEKAYGLDNYYAGGKKQLAKNMIQQIEGIKRSEMLLIGDTTHDFEVAKHIDVPCILLSHGHHSHERLVACTQKTYTDFIEFRNKL